MNTSLLSVFVSLTVNVNFVLVLVNVCSILLISTVFFWHRWTIRGRVTQKSAIRTWSNSRGEGKLFNIILVDESGEIRATAFTQEVEKFYNLIEVNKVRRLSKDLYFIPYVAAH